MESGVQPPTLRGNLAFSSGFEGGNLGTVLVKQPREEYTLSIRPDTNNVNYRLWFHFQVRFESCLLACL